MKGKELKLTEEEKAMEKNCDLEHKLYEEANKLKVVSEFLESMFTKDEGGKENLEKLWGAQLIVDGVAENLTKYRSEFLGV